MKRWVAAFVAVVFLSTATLHILSHSDLSERSCSVCLVQQSVVHSPAAAQVANALDPAGILIQGFVLRVPTRLMADAPARAPPVLPV